MCCGEEKFYGKIKRIEKVVWEKPNGKEKRKRPGLQTMGKDCSGWTSLDQLSPFLFISGKSVDRHFIRCYEYKVIKLFLLMIAWNVCRARMKPKTVFMHPTTNKERNQKGRSYWVEKFAPDTWEIKRSVPWGTLPLFLAKFDKWWQKRWQFLKVLYSNRNGSRKREIIKFRWGMWNNAFKRRYLLREGPFPNACK